MRKPKEAWPVADGEPGLVQLDGQISLMPSREQIPAAWVQKKKKKKSDRPAD